MGSMNLSPLLSASSAKSAVGLPSFLSVLRDLKRSGRCIRAFPSSIEWGLFPIFRRLAARRVGSPLKFHSEKRGDSDNDRPDAIENRVIVTAPKWFFVVLCRFMMSKSRCANSRNATLPSADRIRGGKQNSVAKPKPAEIAGPAPIGCARSRIGRVIVIPIVIIAESRRRRDLAEDVAVEIS